MDIEHLGAACPTPLSFMRSLLRRVKSQRWQIKREHFEFDGDGLGEAIYSIQTPNDLFSFVVFAQYHDPDACSDRVISEAWDMTVTLCHGKPDAERLEWLRANVPLQEKGRLDASCLVLSRANKSERNFAAVVESLAAGEQPQADELAKVGYLYRTTAVYGSGKFGMADWQKVSKSYADFAHPFAAEMLTCYLIRQFSFELAEHLARSRAPDTAVALARNLKRYLGIGNATGLGMAPFLINHPQLISRWIEIREIAIARVRANAVVDTEASQRLASLIDKAMLHLEQSAIDNDEQSQRNDDCRESLALLQNYLLQNPPLGSWGPLIEHVEAGMCTPGQELVFSLLLETHADMIIDLADDMSVDENSELDPAMQTFVLRRLIEARYGWALAVDFSQSENQAVFWYRSEQKMEPRLGRRHEEPGDDREMQLGVARAVSECYAALCKVEPSSVAQFVMSHPQHRATVRRLQAMVKTRYGDIRANLLSADVLPIHLLRCKLSFFGVGKFDPRSRLWVRNTMFQGAPLYDELDAHDDDWCYAVCPTQEAKEIGH